MKRIVIILLVIICSVKTFGQIPNKIPAGNGSTLNYQKGYTGADSGVVWIYSYPDTLTASYGFIKGQEGVVIRVGDSLYQRANCKCQWLLVSGAITNIPSLPDGLLSVQGIGLVDTTVTISPNIVWRRSNINYTQTTASIFQINKADSGYSRFDLIYIDSLNVIRLIEGVQDTGVIVPPAMPPHGIQVTIVSIVGDVVQQPVPSISTNYWSPNGNNITSGTAYLGTLNSKSLDFMTGGTVKATLDTIGQLRFPLLNNGNYPHALTFYNNADATVPSFNLAVNTSIAELTLRPNNSGYINGFRMKKSADADSLIGGAYSNMFLQDYGKLKYNSTSSSNTVFEVTQGNTPLVTVNSSSRPSVTIGNDTAYKPSAALNIPSTTQGVLVPRMTTTQMNAIGTPSNGLLIYNLDSTAFYYYQLSAWVKLGASSGGSTPDTVRVIAPLYSIGVNHDSLYIPYANDVDSGGAVTPQQVAYWNLVGSAVQTIVAINDSSFQNTHVDGSVDTVVIRGSGGGGSGWSLTGNAGTDPTVNFIGTTDGAGLAIRVNNIPSGYIGYDGAPAGANNTMLGYNSMASPESGGSNTLNTGIGYSALTATTGSSNTSIGSLSLSGNTTGSYNSAIGLNSGLTSSTGDGNTFIGVNSDVVSDGITYSNAIGAGVKVGLSNATVIGDSLINLYTGIGTSYPQAKLHVVGDGTNTAFFMNGNVGIGTTTPDSAKLVVKGGIITDSIRIGNDWFYTKKITLTPADVYTLNSVPVLAIDAPGTGKAVEIISASARLLYNTTPYDTDATLVLKSVNTITQITSLSFLSTATVGTQFQIGIYTDSFNENSPISITSDQDNSTGDSDLNIYIHYRVVNL